MSQINIPFNGTDYPVDKSALSSATDALKTHLSTVMNGSGAVINLDGTSYNVDSTKLTNATNTFTSHLGTIGGSGSKVVINGVEYSLDSAKMNDAIADLHEIFNSIKTEVKEIAAGLYETGTNYGTMTASWDELVESGKIVVDNGVVYCGKVAPDNLPEVNEYGFYFDVPYYDGSGYEVWFRADGSVEFYWNGEPDGSSMPAGSAVYSTNCADMTSVDNGIATFTDEANMSWWGYNYSICKPVDIPGDLVLPSDGSITSIGDFRFDDEQGMYVGNMAFPYCNNLTGIVIPSSVNNISAGAFEGCISLTNIDMADGLTSIGEHAFSGAGMTNIEIPDSVTSIGEGAFCYCSDLTSVDLSNTLTRIESRLFEYSPSLTCIEIPNGVTTIGSNAFCNCAGLTSVRLPDSVTSIGEYAFSWCSSLASVTILDGVTDIYEFALNECASMTSVTNADGATEIGQFAFYECQSLTSIEIPDGITSIGMSAFAGCTGLTSVIFGENSQLESIGGSAFYYCKSLANIEIPGSVTSIGSGALSGCSSLTSVTIPDSVTSIDEAAFSFCSSLTSINFGGTKSQWNAIAKGSDWNGNTPSYTIYCTDGTLTKSGESVDYSDYLTFALQDDDTYSVAAKDVNNMPAEVVIPASYQGKAVTSIGSYAFFECSSLTSVTIPDGVTSIGDYAFYECSSLTSVTIPDSVTSIAERTFYGCSSLTSVTIPDSVTSIGDYMFEGCIGLTSVIVLAETPPTLGYKAFGLTTLASLTQIKVPAGSVDAYKTAYGWRECAGIIVAI